MRNYICLCLSIVLITGGSAIISAQDKDGDQVITVTSEGSATVELDQTQPRKSKKVKEKATSETQPKSTATSPPKAKKRKKAVKTPSLQKSGEKGIDVIKDSNAEEPSKKEKSFSGKKPLQAKERMEQKDLLSTKKSSGKRTPSSKPNEKTLIPKTGSPETAEASDTSDRSSLRFKAKIKDSSSTGTGKSSSVPKFGPGVTKIDSQEAISSLGVPMWRIALTLAVLILIILGILYGVKKLGHRFGGIEVGANIKVLTRMHVDTKNQLLLVRVHEEELLLGVGQNSVNLLSKYTALDTDLDDDAEQEVGQRENNEPDNPTKSIDESLSKSPPIPGPTTLNELMERREKAKKKRNT